jgi:hypothetical protein
MVGVMMDVSTRGCNFNLGSDDGPADYGCGREPRTLTPQQWQVYFARRKDMVPLTPVLFGLEFDEALLAFWGS